MNKFIRENGGWENFDMILIETCKCENGLDAERKERKYVEELKASLNCTIPSRTIKEQDKQYYEQNKKTEQKTDRCVGTTYG